MGFVGQESAENGESRGLNREFSGLNGGPGTACGFPRPQIAENVGPSNAENSRAVPRATRLKFLNVFSHFLDPVLQLIAGFDQIALVENHAGGHEYDELGAVVAVVLLAE
jgi:hypothetical protein